MTRDVALDNVIFLSMKMIGGNHLELILNSIFKYICINVEKWFNLLLLKTV